MFSYHLHSSTQSNGLTTTVQLTVFTTVLDLSAFEYIVDEILFQTKNVLRNNLFLFSFDQSYFLFCEHFNLDAEK